ncbi:MAG: ferrous iron transporter B [Polyangiaceae bacterium]
MSEHCSPPIDSRRTGTITSERVGVLIVGRPNSGKSSLYNAITGGDAHVGNFPGITVDVLEADVDFGDGLRTRVADLPGFYSVHTAHDPDTDEGVARTFVERAETADSPVVLAQVIDAAQLRVGLRLTNELVARKLPLVVFLTQADRLERERKHVDAARLAEELGAPVRLVSSRDSSVRAKVGEGIRAALAADPGLRPSTFDVDEVWRRVERTLERGGTGTRSATSRIDSVLLHPVLGPFLFVGMMAAAFAAVFLVSDPVTQVFDGFVARMRSGLVATLGEGLLTSFLTDAVLGGVGTVLTFTPQIVILTIVMELLDATGYLARGAFLADRVLRALGLTGRSFLPLLMGHACAVPAITSTRIVRDPRERLTTILVLPLMTCSARIPTYALVLGTFFAARGAWFKASTFVGLYFFGLLSGLVASLVLRRTTTRGRSLPLVLEMPPYRSPSVALVARRAGKAAVRFVKDVGTVILAGAVALWVLLTVPMPVSLRHVPGPGEPTPTQAENSVAAGIGRAMETVTAPLGFDWRINVGLIGSFGARELMVGTMGVITGVESADDDTSALSERLRGMKKSDGTPAYGTRTALALLVFFALACQCMSTVAAIRRETRSWKWPVFVLGYTYVAAYAVALVVSQVARFFGAS